MKKQNFKDKLHVHTRQKFEPLERRIAALETTVQTFVRKQAIKDAVYVSSLEDYDKQLELVEQKVQLKVKELYDEINSTFEQYKSESEMQTFVEEAMGINGEKSEVIVGLSEKEQQLALDRLVKERNVALRKLHEVGIEEKKYWIAKEELVTELGTLPLKRHWISHLYYPSMTIPTFVEYSINKDALIGIESNLTYLECVVLAIAMGVVCAVAAHFLGFFLATSKQKDIPLRELKMELGACATIIVCVFICIIGLRLNGSVWTLILLNAAMILVSTLLSFLHSDVWEKEKNDYFEYERKHGKICQKADELGGDIQTLETKIAAAEQGVYVCKAKDSHVDAQMAKHMRIAAEQLKTYKRELLSKLTTIYQGAVTTYKLTLENTIRRNGQQRT